MFFVRGNENRVKYGLRYSRYLVRNVLPRKLKRIKADGFSFGFPFGFNINFRLMSLDEYHNKYCLKNLPICCGRAPKNHQGLDLAKEAKS